MTGLRVLMTATAFAGMVSAAAAETVVFKGAIVVDSATTACTAGGSLHPLYSWGVTNAGSMAIRPGNLGTNGPSTILQFFRPNPTGDGTTEHFMLDSGSLTQTYQTVSGLHLALGDETPVQSYSAKMRLTKQTPAVIGEDTKFVTIKGQIQTFNGIAGCTMSFSAALVK